MLSHNETHRYSVLRFMAPGQSHRGEDNTILQEHRALYEQAEAQHFERWSGPTGNWSSEEIVYLNPGKPTKKDGVLKQK